jgi:hypothetical protein
MTECLDKCTRGKQQQMGGENNTAGEGEREESQGSERGESQEGESGREESQGRERGESQGRERAGERRARVAVSHRFKPLHLL